MKASLARFTVWLFAQLMTVGFALSQVLTHGPVVGGVTASEAKVFVRTDKVAGVVLWYGTDPNLVTYLTSDPLQTSSTSDFTKIIPLASLAAETTYYLNVVVNGVPQSASPPYPSFTTFAASGTARNFNFVVLTDFATVKNLTRDVQTFASAAAELPAFTFIGGDFDHRNPITLGAKRQMFRDLYDPSTLHMSGFVPLILQKMAIIHQWDDHDSGQNNLDRTYPNWSLTLQAFQEYVPTYALPPVSGGIWQKFSYAQVDGFVLDCRSQRDPETDPDDFNKSMLDGNNLGTSGQLEWLKNGLLASTARWKIIFTSVVTNSSTKFPDGWAGYQTEWNALKAFINTNNIQGIVFISGDLHLGAIDNGVQAGFPELCVSQPNGIDGHPTDSPGIWSEGYYDDSTCSGYGLVTISSDPDRLVLEAVDEFGNIKISYTLSDTTPLIVTQPVDTTVSVGKKARFLVTATGTKPLTYQWKKNGVNITRASKATYTTPPTTSTDDGAIFSVAVTNPLSSVTSNSAVLTVK